MNSYELKNMMAGSDWEYSDAQWEAMAGKLRNILPYSGSAIVMGFSTKPTPEKLVSAIFKYARKEQRSSGYCECCNKHKGNLSVAKLKEIPSSLIGKPTLYPKDFISCPICQDKSHFVNYITQCLNENFLPCAVAYLDIYDTLKHVYPIILEVINDSDFHYYLNQSYSIWNPPAGWQSIPKVAM